MTNLFQFVSQPVLGLPLVAWGGITTLLILILQILVGFRLIPVNFKYHKWIAITLLVVALIHMTAAMIYILG